MSESIRIAKEEDKKSILDILNQSIKDRKFTALLTEATLENRKEWFNKHSDKVHPIFVYERDNEVLGWMAVSEYRDGREGFKHTCEISYYIDENSRNNGIATKLLDHVLSYSKENGLKNLMAVIFEDNIYSRSLVEKFGFTKWGYFPDIVEIDGQTKGCLQYGRKL